MNRAQEGRAAQLVNDQDALASLGAIVASSAIWTIELSVLLRIRDDAGRFAISLDDREQLAHSDWLA